MNSTDGEPTQDEPQDSVTTSEAHQADPSEPLLDAFIDHAGLHSALDSLDAANSAPPRSVTYLNGLALVIGFQIGSGIFSAPAVVLSNVGSPLTAVLVWFLAGVLVWSGASSFIELGTRVPQNGGIQEYLRHCYGDIYGFLFALIWILVSRPCAMAMVSLVFAEYLFRAIWPGDDPSVWILKITAFAAIICITYLNCIGTHYGIGAANFFLVLKVFGLGSIAVTGFASAFINSGSQPNPQPNTTMLISESFPIEALTASTWLWTSLGGFADATFAALFAYGGWEAISFVIGEMKEPHSTLPKVLNSSMAIVVTLFVAANIAIYNTLPLEILEKTNAVAIAFGMKALGRPGALFYAWIVCLSCLGALNAIVFSAGRLTQAAGARQYIPSFLNSANNSKATRAQSPHIHARRNIPNDDKAQNVPLNAMAFNATVASMYVLVGSFRGLLTFKGMIEYVVYLTTVSGLLFLRFRRPLDANTLGQMYLTPIINPIVFCSVASLMVIRSAIAHMIQALIILLILGAGILVYRSRWWRSLVAIRPADSV
ncbi:amino acid transporter [Mollisia scopiformis]|uniref:Amino acid transporter n=1 Tax=Mollisia scopiformis TaxID=149040 RepID=A0A194X923_MOLSC|nr:amino acid transporter [Mollisia scopiformis]KUJ16670.1 amino acid transporter [Mollisia scopiformis]